MALAPLPSAPDDRRLHQAAEAMEALLLKQIVRSSGAFGGGESAGSGVRADLFADTLADAVAHAGGIGIAAELERSLSQPTGGIPNAAHAPSTISSGAGVVAGLTQPLTSARLTSGFGIRIDPLTGKSARHHGLDLAAPEGSTITTAAPGIVKIAGERGGYGLAVEIDHGGGVATVYGHASELLVREGDQVSAGQPIARVGDTGRSTGPHLHFELRVHGQAVDPSRALKNYGRRADETGVRSLLAAARTP
jgi:murein DD-endopeptidase MepM/ murein hydrolase activator NlpD